MDNFSSNIDNGKKEMSKGNYSEAIVFLEAAKSQNEKNMQACRLLGNCYRIIGKIDESIEVYKEGLRRGYHAGTHQRLLNAMNYTNTSQENIANEHMKWANINMPERQLVHLKSRKKVYNKIIRVGYISADFKSHPVSYFLLPIYKNHNKKKFQIISFYNGITEDNVTKKFKKLSDKWYKTREFTTDQLCNIIKSEKVDLLVDLSGHTAGNRMDVFAKKPVRCQVTYLGYPNTTGLKSIDYRIVDNITDPVNIPENWHSEKLFRIPGCFLCFEPPKENLYVLETPVLKNRFVTFGTFNKISKITDDIIRTWINILKLVPTSKLMLKSINLDKEIEKGMFLNRIKKLGFKDFSRIVFHGLVPSRSQHMMMYNEMDIALDTFPYNGATTTMQALYMSVPVITLNGKSHISRVSRSILCNMELAELVATNENEYIEKAVSLAKDINRIVAYKRSIREQMLKSSLVDANLFVDKLENFYSKILNVY